MNSKFTPICSRSIHGGIQHVYEFPNGYGASVVRHSFSHGNDLGLWELAVLDSEGDITYDTPITDDVIGYLDANAVENILQEISELENVRVFGEARVFKDE